MAAAAAPVPFQNMSEAELRQWVEANPGRVNDRDTYGHTPLYVAVCFKKSPPLTVWLLDEKGADVNATLSRGSTLLHVARSLDILTALLDRGVDPTVLDYNGSTVLMYQASNGRVENVARLLQDPRVRAAVNVQTRDGKTALHLLQASANPAITNNSGETPLAELRKLPLHYHAAIALLEQVSEAQKAALLVKARLVLAAMAATASNTGVPSCLQGRAAGGQPLPFVVLHPAALPRKATGGRNTGGWKHRKACRLVAFLLGMEGGPENTGMPRDVFRGVFMDLLMPSWDPLRRKGAGTGVPPQG